MLLNRSVHARHAFSSLLPINRIFSTFVFLLAGTGRTLQWVVWVSQCCCKTQTHTKDTLTAVTNTHSLQSQTHTHCTHKHTPSTHSLQSQTHIQSHTHTHTHIVGFTFYIQHLHYQTYSTSAKCPLCTSSDEAEDWLLPDWPCWPCVLPQHQHVNSWWGLFMDLTTGHHCITLMRYRCLRLAAKYQAFHLSWPGLLW